MRCVVMTRGLHASCAIVLCCMRLVCVCSVTLAVYLCDARPPQLPEICFPSWPCITKQFNLRSLLYVTNCGLVVAQSMRKSCVCLETAGWRRSASTA